ncbi:MAG TPA: homoserine O-succinyltransferase [Xanthomonadaceae bacterium]|jgi:homoserine O-acetyltransferase|nr:homoserine O-succinyltransferase [Xanthomonadaceae bacterium]
MSFAPTDSCNSTLADSHVHEVRPSRITEHTSPCAVVATRGEFELSIALRHADTQDLHLRARWQRLGDAHLPAIVVQGGISADRRAAAAAADEAPGWWQAQIGSGRALDPRQVQVISIDWLGADGALDVPIDTTDQADAIAATLDRLGVARIEAFIGCSYGALVGLQFAARYPSRLRELVAIAGAHRPHPYASALRALQRKVVALGQLQCADELGLSLARQLAMLTYRVPEEFAQRFDAQVLLDGSHARCAAEDYLESCGERYAQRWSPTAFVRLSESIDLHRVEPACVEVPTTLVAVFGDRLVPPEDVHELAARIGGPVRVHVLRSLYGHDAFLKEAVMFDAILRDLRVVACGGAA